MNYIELIGPPGVGKTTLLNTLANSRKTNEWNTYEEAIYKITDSLEWHQLSSPKSKLLYLINKANFASYKKLGISSMIIKEVVPQVAGVIQKKYEYLIEAQLQAIQTLSPQISPINKCSFLNWHFQALKKLFVLETFGYTKTILLAEGPLKNHHGLNHIIHTNITPNTLPKAVIFCTLSISKNIQRIQNRFRLTKRVSTIHNNLNDAPIEELVSQSHEIANANFIFIKTMGIPVFEVDLTNPMTEPKLDELFDFISTHTSSKPNNMLEYA